MTSSYPTYDATYAFDTELDDVIELIQKIRKAKVEYKIGKEYQLVLNGAKKYQDILTKMLKLDVSQCLDKMEDETLTCLSLPYQNDTVSLYYDGSANKEEERLKLEENKASLEQSITRREKLLANENYVSKAPSHIVEQERTNLEK